MAGIATGGVGTAGARVAKLAGLKYDGVHGNGAARRQPVFRQGHAKKDEYMTRRMRFANMDNPVAVRKQQGQEEAMAPALESVEAEGASRAVGWCRGRLQGVMPSWPQDAYPITLTQGQPPGTLRKCRMVQPDSPGQPEDVALLLMLNDQQSFAE